MALKSETQTSGIKIRLNHANTDEILRIVPAKLTSTIIESYNNLAMMEPRVVLNIDDRRLIAELVGVVTEDMVQYLEWRNSHLDIGVFRQHCESAVREILQRWARKEFGKAITVNYAGLFTEERA